MMSKIPRKNCTECTLRHWTCVFESPSHHQCTRCIKNNLICFFKKSGEYYLTSLHHFLLHSTQPLLLHFFFVAECVLLLLCRMAQAMFIATCLWKLIIALISTPSDYVLLLLCRMAQAMSIATCLWKLITALNSTPSACAAAASKCSQDHPLLRRSQQMLSIPDVDTTPPVAHCAGPINCCFYCIARFTIKTIPESCSRTSTTCWIADKNPTIHFCDKHACVLQ